MEQFEFSVYLRDTEWKVTPHKIAKVTISLMVMREEMTHKDEEVIQVLRLDWYGKVASIDGTVCFCREKRLGNMQFS